METNGKLAGKKALVTGSGTGIGREIALEFARQIATHGEFHFFNGLSAAELFGGSP